MKVISKVLLAPNCVIDWKASPHMIVSGVTGSTKTNTLEDILLSSMSAKSRLDSQQMGMCAKAYLIDGKGADLASLKSLHPAVTPNQAARVLRIITKNMHKRYNRFSGDFGKVASDYIENDKSVRNIVLIIDELAVLLNDPKIRSEILRYLFDLLVAARQASIYVSPFGATLVVVGIQRPSAEILPRDTTLQFNNRLLMAPNGADNDTKRMLFPMSDAKGLPLTENVKEAALFYKNGFIMPKPVYFPNMSTIDIPKVVKRIQKEVNSNWFIQEDYWEEP